MVQAWTAREGEKQWARAPRTGSQRDVQTGAPVKLAFAANARAGTMEKERGAARVIGLASTPAQLYSTRPIQAGRLADETHRQEASRPRICHSSAPARSIQNTQQSHECRLLHVLAAAADNASHISKASALSTPAITITAPHGQPWTAPSLAGEMLISQSGRKRSPAR